MQVTVNESFEVNAPRDAVWALLSDPRKVVTCVPGARITGQTGDDLYTGVVRMKVGPVVTNFSGEIRIEKKDDETAEFILVGRGRDAKGKGSADMRLVGSVNTIESGLSQVSSSMTLSISGRLAQFGSRLMQDVTKRVFQQFVECFRSNVLSGSDQSAEEVDALGLLLGTVKDRLKRR